MDENNKKILNINNGASYFSMIIIYFIVFVIALASIIFVFDRLINEHDKKLTQEMCNIVAEKINSSIDYMTDSVKNVSNVISNTDCRDFSEIYKQISSTSENATYLSAGIITNDGVIYALDTEKNELQKWELVSPALSSENVFISEPYRSGLTGQMVFSMFCSFYIDEEKAGSIYLTYPLEVIQEMANTRSLNNEAEIFLMDANSDNLINCSGTSVYSAGSWTNIKLDKSRIRGKDFSKWQEDMRNGETSAAVVYSLDGVDYTQVFEQIDFMPGWNVVVKLPSSSLSEVMIVFRTTVILFAVFLMTATMILVSFIHKRETTEKKMFENLSIYDPLTKIMNRRAFEFSANEQISGKYSKNAQALMFIDIDYFKHVNDNYGHEAGDYILTEVARGLQTVFKENSLIARYGGDEFIVLTKYISREAINEKLEKLRDIYKQVKIKDAKVPADDFELHFSAGIAVFPSDGEELKDLLKNADAALYEVKERGRNGYGWFENKK